MLYVESLFRVIGTLFEDSFRTIAVCANLVPKTLRVLVVKVKDDHIRSRLTFWKKHLYKQGTAEEQDRRCSNLYLQEEMIHKAY